MRVAQGRQLMARKRSRFGACRALEIDSALGHSYLEDKSRPLHASRPTFLLTKEGSANGLRAGVLLGKERAGGTSTPAALKPELKLLLQQKLAKLKMFCWIVERAEMWRQKSSFVQLLPSSRTRQTRASQKTARLPQMRTNHY